MKTRHLLVTLAFCTPALALAQSASAPLPVASCLASAGTDAAQSLALQLTASVVSKTTLASGELLEVYRDPAAPDSVLWVEHLYPPRDTLDARGGRPGWTLPVCVGKAVASADRVTWVVYRRTRTTTGKLTWARLATLPWRTLLAQRDSLLRVIAGP